MGSPKHVSPPTAPRLFHLQRVQQIDDISADAVRHDRIALRN
jgi:hypothetical protein